MIAAVVDSSAIIAMTEENFKPHPEALGFFSYLLEGDNFEDNKPKLSDFIITDQVFYELFGISRNIQGLYLQKLKEALKKTKDYDEYEKVLAEFAAMIPRQYPTIQEKLGFIARHLFDDAEQNGRMHIVPTVIGATHEEHCRKAFDKVFAAFEDDTPLTVMDLIYLGKIKGDEPTIIYTEKDKYGYQKVIDNRCMVISPKKLRELEMTGVSIGSGNYKDRDEAKQLTFRDLSEEEQKRLRTETLKYLSMSIDDVQDIGDARYDKVFSKAILDGWASFNEVVRFVRYVMPDSHLGDTMTIQNGVISICLSNSSEITIDQESRTVTISGKLPYDKFSFARENPAKVHGDKKSRFITYSFDDFNFGNVNEEPSKLGGVYKDNLKSIIRAITDSVFTEYGIKGRSSHLVDAKSVSNFYNALSNFRRSCREFFGKERFFQMELDFATKEQKKRLSPKKGDLQAHNSPFVNAYSAVQYLRRDMGEMSLIEALELMTAPITHTHEQNPYNAMLQGKEVIVIGHDQALAKMVEEQVIPETLMNRTGYNDIIKKLAREQIIARLANVQHYNTYAFTALGAKLAREMLKDVKGKDQQAIFDKYEWVELFANHHKTNGLPKGDEKMRDAVREDIRKSYEIDAENSSFANRIGILELEPRIR